MKKFIEKYNIQLKLLLALSLGLIVLTVILYFLIPYVLNYPEGTYGTDFQSELEGTNYISQTISISLSIFLTFVFITFSNTRFLVKYNDIFTKPNKYTIKDINLIKEKLLTVPYKLLLANTFIPSIVLTIVHAVTINQISITTLKLFLLIYSVITIYVTSVFIYTLNLFKTLLAKLPNTDNKNLKRVSLRKRFINTIFSVILVSIIFCILISFSSLSSLLGDHIFIGYQNDLEIFKAYSNFTDINDLATSANESIILHSESDYIFIEKDNIFFSTNLTPVNMSDFFIKYLNDLSAHNNGRVYEYYGIDSQAATTDIYINGQLYRLGIYYNIFPDEIILTSVFIFAVLFIINLIIIFLFSRSLSKDINLISNSFNNMLNNKNENMMTELPLTSNDEIGNLILSYNKIQKLNNDNISKIHSNQETLMEKERLASLGQLIGGIAHNLKTPIMSISGASEGLHDLVKEYDSSIEDPDVTPKDHHEIASEMTEWINKIHNYTQYMSDIITAVKGQAVNFNTDDNFAFTIEELLQRIDILMKHELKSAKIDLNISLNISSNSTITGDINSLVQVINNMISNSIQAYAGNENEAIDLNISENKSHIIIQLKDYASGLPTKVKEKLFKEMITTKGKDGTGLGLYMSYSTIRGHFHGDITVESKENLGTTFNIILPK